MSLLLADGLFLVNNIHFLIIFVSMPLPRLLLIMLTATGFYILSHATTRNTTLFLYKIASSSVVSYMKSGSHYAAEISRAEPLLSEILD